MPTMIPMSNKATKIKEKLMGSPRNEHIAHTRDPQIRESDRQRVMTALILNDFMNQSQMDPQNNQGMM